MVSIIIPAYNEEKTIGASVRALFGHPQIREIIVVDDGSSDGTAEIAKAQGARVIRLARNSGKSAAMDEGVLAAQSDIVCFIDADVTGLDHDKLSRIIGPVVRGEREMHVGVRARDTFLFNRIFHIFPIIGGERALTKSLWNSFPIEHKRGFQIEIALNYAAKQTERGMSSELITGVQHHIKEKKYGLVVGFARRMGMIKDIVLISFGLYVLGFLYKAFPPLQRLSKVKSINGRV